MLIVLGILMLLGLVILHELGHFWAARRAGIEVEEFGVGFPPKAKTLAVKNGTEYTLNWLPLGGFVKLKGEHDSDTAKGSFGAATLRQKVLVMVAGVGMNIIAAVVLLSIIAAVGMPKVLDNQFTVASDNKIVQQDVVISYVEPDSPAANARPFEVNGFEGSDFEAVYPVQAGDVLKSLQCFACSEKVEGQTLFTIDSADKLRSITIEKSDDYGPFIATLTRENVEYKVYIEPLSSAEVEASKNTDNPKGYIGVVPSDYIKQQATWSAPIVGAVTTVQFFGETLKGLGGLIADLFRGDGAKASEQVTGVVGIGYVLSELSQQGFMSVLFLTAIISISLAVMNILPIPALDGGRLFVTLLFRVLRKPLNKETEERIHGTGFALLMALFVLITILDVQKFILD